MQGGSQVAAGLVLLALQPTRSSADGKHERHDLDILSNRESAETAVYQPSIREYNNDEDDLPYRTVSFKSKKYKLEHKNKHNINLFNNTDLDEKYPFLQHSSSLHSNFDLEKRSLVLGALNSSRYPLARMRWLVSTAFAWRNVCLPDVVAKSSLQWLGGGRVGTDFSDDVNDNVMIDASVAPMVMFELWRHTAVVRYCMMIFCLFVSSMLRYILRNRSS